MRRGAPLGDGERFGGNKMGLGRAKIRLEVTTYALKGTRCTLKGTRYALEAMGCAMETMRIAMEAMRERKQRVRVVWLKVNLIYTIHRAIRIAHTFKCSPFPPNSLLYYRGPAILRLISLPCASFVEGP